MTERHDRFWAAFLGVEPTAWSVSGVSVRPHAGLAGYRGVWFFRRRDHVVVSAPPGWVAHLEARLADVRPSSLLEEHLLRAFFGAAAEKIVGPAFHGALAPERFEPQHRAQVRRVKDADGPAVASLRRAAGREAWEASGLAKAEEPLTAAVTRDGIVALGGYRAWAPDAGDPCLLAHPAHQRQGWATAVASAVVARALEQGQTVLYQTLEANASAVALALRLGYERYARHVAVRLTSAEPVGDGSASPLVG